MVIDLFGSSDDDDPDDDAELVADRSQFDARPTTEHHDHTPTQNKSLLDMATGNDTSNTDHDVPADQPTQLDMVHQELELLITTFHSKQVAVRERQDIIDQYVEIGRNIATLLDKDIEAVDPDQNPTMQEMGDVFANAKQQLTPENIDVSHPDDLLFKIYNQSQRLQQLIGEKDNFEYAYSETDINQVYGHEIQSFGLPNGIDPAKLPPGEDGEEVYARGRALTAMENLAEDPTSPLWLGVGTRNGHDASVEKDVLFRHRAIFGQTGYGKSTLLTNDAKQLIESGAGMCFIDPKGDDSKRLMQIIPEERLDDVLWIEPGANGEHLSGFNYIKLGMDQDDDGYEIARSNLVADLKRMLKMSSDYWGPRMDRVAENLITAMNMYNDRTPDDAAELNLVDLYYVLKSEASRKEFAARCKKAGLTFVDDYTEEIAQMNNDDLEPLLGRFLPWIENPVARRMIGFRKGGVNIPKAIDDNKIIIVRMGSEPRELKQMLGMAVIRRIWSRIRSRANESIHNREPFYLFVDEFDNIALADDTIPSIISESRSYRLSLNIANQYPKQLPGNVVDAITTNCDTIISFNPGDVQSANQYCTQLGVDADTLTEEVNYHVWLRTTLKDNMEKSDAFRAYVYPPHPPKRIEEDAQKSIDESLRRHGRRRRSDEETYANLLFNGGGGKWETGVGQQIAMTDDADMVRDLEAELRAVMPGPESPQVRDSADFGQGDVDDETDAGMNSSPVLSDGESVVNQKEETILEAIFAAAVRQDREPGSFVSHDAVIQELKHRLPDNITAELAEVANAFEQLSSEYVESERISGDQQIRLTNSGQAKVFDQDTGSDVTGGGNEHRWVIRKSFAIFTRLGYITERVKQDGGALPDAVADAPFDFTDVDDDLAPQKKVEKIEEQRERLQSEYPEVWNLSQGNDVSIEAETTTIKTPVRMLTNLKKAMNEGNTCVFVTKEGDEEFTEWGERGEKNIYETKDSDTGPGTEIVSDTPTFIKGRGRDGIRRYYNKKQKYALDEDRDKIALRPASEKRGSVWYHDPDTGEIVCAPSNNQEIDDNVEKLRFDDIDAVKEGDPTAVAGYYEYNPGEKQYEVNAGGKKLIYNSAEELKEDWEPFKKPLIPEHEFGELPSEEDWHFVILPDADNDQYDQPQLYERGECRPLYDAIGADIDSVDVNTLGDDAGTDGYEGESFADEDGEPEVDTGNAPGEYTTDNDDGEVEEPEAQVEAEEQTDTDSVEEAIDSEATDDTPSEPADSAEASAPDHDDPDHQADTSNGESATATNTTSSGSAGTAEEAAREEQPPGDQQASAQTEHEQQQQQQESHQQANEQAADSDSPASKAEIIAQIDRLADGVGKPPDAVEFDNHPDTVSIDEVLTQFDNWRAAADTAVGNPDLADKEEDDTTEQTESETPTEDEEDEAETTTTDEQADPKSQSDTAEESDPVDDTPGGDGDGDGDTEPEGDNADDVASDRSIPDKTATPHEILDHPDMDGKMSRDRLGRIGGGAEDPSNREFDLITHRLRSIDPDLARFVEDRTDLQHVIENGGGRPNSMQSDDTAADEDNDDTTDTTASEQADPDTVDDPEPGEADERTDETYSPDSAAEGESADTEADEEPVEPTDGQLNAVESDLDVDWETVTHGELTPKVEKYNIGLPADDLATKLLERNQLSSDAPEPEAQTDETYSPESEHEPADQQPDTSEEPQPADADTIDAKIDAAIADFNADGDDIDGLEVLSTMDELMETVPQKELIDRIRERIEMHTEPTTDEDSPTDNSSTAANETQSEDTHSENGSQTSAEQSTQAATNGDEATISEPQPETDPEPESDHASHSQSSTPERESSPSDEVENQPSPEEHDAVDTESASTASVFPHPTDDSQPPADGSESTTGIQPSVQTNERTNGHSKASESDSTSNQEHSKNGTRTDDAPTEQASQQPSESHRTADNETEGHSTTSSSSSTAAETDASESITDMSASSNTPSADDRTNGQREATESDPHSTTDTSTPDSADQDTATSNHNESEENEKNGDPTTVDNDTDSGDSSDDGDLFGHL